MQRCEYCKELKEYTTLISKNTYICPECQKVVNNNCQLNVKQKNYGLISPVEIKSFLDRFVISQEEAKRTLSIEAYNHLKRCRINSLADVEKNNILLVGPSGCGKTYLVETLAKAIGVPFVSINATEFTASGYVGKSVSSIGKYLLDESDGDVYLAEQGIVFIDEIDKIAGNDSYGKDVGGVEVQKALLKIIEGELLRPDKEEGGFFDDINDMPVINTKNILFIFSGAFESLRNNPEKTISFSEKENNAQEITPELLIKNGFIKEFIGRIPIINEIEKLSIENIVDILTKTENSLIEQYKKLLAYDGINLEFTDDAIYEIAKMAYDRNIGARGCKTILSNLMNKICFFNNNKMNSHIIITKEIILKQCQKNDKKKKQIV